MSDQYPPPGGYPPPPGGGDPYGQQPPQYGQQPQYGGAPQYGDQPFSGAPQYGDQSQFGGAPQYGPPPGGAPFGAPPPPPRRSKAGKIILIIVAVIVALCLICGGILYATGSSIFDSIKNSSTNAKVGDCLEGDTIESDATKEVDLKIVKCDDAKAKYKVVGIKEGVARAEALKKETTVCNDYIDAGAESVLWQGTDVTDGQALCLAPAK